MQAFSKQLIAFHISSPLRGIRGGLLFLFVFVNTSMAQDINIVLRSIDEGNLQLRAARHANAATVAETQSENTLGETSVEYSPFYQSGVMGLASSELIVSQEFDFPTLYSARRKTASLQQQMLDDEYQLLRRDILFEGASLCFDLYSAQQTALLLQQRLDAADSLLSICQRRLQHGDATIIELNRVKMDHMTVMKEKIQNQGEITTLRLALQKMAPQLQFAEDDVITVSNIDYPIPAVSGWSAASSSLTLSQHETTIARQGWLPKLTAGYRRNTEMKNAQNGVLVGVALPLFTNKSKVKAARMRQDAAEQELERVRSEADNKRHALITEKENLQQLLSAYDTDLMHQTLSLLMRAVTAGQLSIIDYYTEADRIYTALQEHLATQNKYSKTTLESTLY